MFSWLRRDLEELGPGLVTGASDDDPSGIATYSQAGAGFGFSTLWSILFTIPLMIAVEEMCARIALVTKRGLIANIRLRHSRPLVAGVVFLLFIANTINLGADLGMMASAAELIFPLSFEWMLILIAVMTLLLQIFIPYRVYAKVLKWLTLSLLAYVAVAFTLNMDWETALGTTLIPQIQFTKEYVLIFIALLGTTISPYLFFWQANQEVEDEQENGGVYGHGSHSIARYIKRMRFDVSVGMIFSNVVAWFIILSAAVVLFAHGITTIGTADEAARVLEPIAGPWAATLFTIGIIGTGLLAVPVLSSTAAYAFSELLGKSGGLSKQWFQAKFFYAVIVLSTVLGVVMNASGISPVRALIYAAIINAIVAPPILYLIIRFGNDRRVMGRHVNGRWSRFFGWLTFFVMVAAPLIWIVMTVSQEH